MHDTALAGAVMRPGGIIMWHDYHDLGTVDVKSVLESYAPRGPRHRTRRRDVASVRTDQVTVALVLGGAACVWADALAALRLFTARHRDRHERHDPAMARARSIAR